MRAWWRRPRPKRAELIDRKHALAGEISMLAGEVRRLRSRGQPTGAAERRLEQLRSQHYQTRLEIDQAEH
ncbi:MAG: hypothetical protein HKN94_03775 [Acidimicrobiales bacterium]|nr:hypothetical protein [Acidimicrobiales bacterium]